MKQKTPNADCSRYFLGVLVGSPSLRLAESEKRSIFRMHLENALKDMRLDVEDKVNECACVRKSKGFAVSCWSSSWFGFVPL